jgi:HAD superfamily phosphatase (TIGR01668 family)
VLGKLFPHEHVRGMEDVDYDRLLGAGYENFFFDYDFTLAPWGDLRISEKIVETFEYLRKRGARVFVVTNAKRDRVDHLKKILPWVEIYWNMKKPSIRKLKGIMDEKGIDPKKSVIIGDLFLTDILAGNRLGMYTVMVNPVTFETMRVWKKIVAFLSMILYGFFLFTFGWVFRTGKLASPNEWRKSVREVHYDSLLKNGFEAFVFDFDNTLAPWKSSEILPENNEILEELKEKATVIIASNGRPREVDAPVRIIWKSYKPFGFKIKRALREMGVDFKKVVVIGDQLFTDVLFGNIIGAYTIKVNPISKEEAIITKFNRALERIFSKLVVQKPSVTKEETKE